MVVAASESRMVSGNPTPMAAMAAAARKALWKAGTSAAPVAPAGADAATTVTRMATPKPPATWVWVWNSAAPRPVSAEEMVANDAVWHAMTHQPLAKPLLKASTRI